MRLRPLVLAAVLGTSASGIATAVAAQDPATPGATVRVWSPELPRRPQPAVLGAWSPDSLELHALARRGRQARALDTAPSWVVPRRSVTRLDVLVPRTRREGARTWGLVGAATGALTGVMLGALAAGLGAEYYPRGTDQPGVSPMYFSVPVGAALGATMGGLVGALMPGKRWRTTPMPHLGSASAAAPPA